jgi:hypothetical protein
MNGPTFTRRAAICAAFAASLGVATPVFADPLLTLMTGEGEVALTREDIEAYAQHEIITATEFTDGEVTFRGPLVRDVLTPPEGATIAVMRAINDYAVEIPLEDFTRFDVILATHMDGTALSRRDKGPIWVMYPLDDHAELADAVYVNRLIWQLAAVSYK